MSAVSYAGQSDCVFEKFRSNPRIFLFFLYLFLRSGEVRLFPLTLVLVESWICSGWKDLMEPLVQCSAQSNGSAEFRPGCSGLCQVSNTSRDGNATTLRLNLFQCLVTLMVEFFITPCWNLPLVTLWLLSLILTPCSSVESLAGSPPCPAHRGWQCSLLLPKSFLLPAKPAPFPPPLSPGHVLLLSPKIGEIWFLSHESF